MQTKRKKRNGLRTFGIFLLVAIFFAILWMGAALYEKVAGYSRTAMVAEADIPAEDPASLRSSPALPEEDYPDDGSSPSLRYPDVALNTYDTNGFFREGPFRRYVDEKSAAGVDVSSHNGVIDWPSVKAAGADFALLRAGYRGYTEGQLQADSQFSQNLSGARDAGLQLGVYFFSQAVTADEAEEEAQFVLSLLGGAMLEYPIFFDWEDMEQTARTDGMDSITLTACAKAFCETVEAAGYHAGIYFNQNFGYQEFDLSELKDYTFWLAEYADVPTFTYDFAVWQYSNTGTLDGIPEKVDLNLAFRKQ